MSDSYPPAQTSNTPKPAEDAAVADAQAGNWVDARAPVWLRPYARLARWDRPIGSWLLLWPCWWSAALAAQAAGWPVPDVWHLALFAIGAVAMRGAGCTYNDIVDRHLDAQVARTRSRPIPSGAISVDRAREFLVAQCLVGLLVLVQFNLFTIWLGIVSLAIVAAYPFMKRITDWPQSVLGLAFSWGALMGWAAVFASLGPAPLALYLGAVFWTIGYDTIYAHQDREDDALIGVRSTARLFGANTRPWLVGFYLMAVALIAAAGFAAGAGIVFALALVFGGAHLAWQVATLDTEDGARCLMLFKSNRDFGLIVFAGLVADSLLRF